MVNFWQISPGREERGLWPEFKNSNIIAIGWDNLGDLKKCSSEKDVENALRKQYPMDYPKNAYPINDINSIMSFCRSVKKGDIIVAKKGASKGIYGIGKVQSEYHFVDSRDTFKHVVGVDWIISFDAKIRVEISNIRANHSSFSQTGNVR